jgi:hypothetical protein
LLHLLELHDLGFLDDLQGVAPACLLVASQAHPAECSCISDTLPVPRVVSTSKSSSFSLAFSIIINYYCIFIKLTIKSETTTTNKIISSHFQPLLV